MKTEIKQVTITPDMAAELLQRNKNNRSVRKNNVDTLAMAMAKGEWELSNDAIVISEGGFLLNGQHRLLAVIKSGVACPFILFTGAKDTVFDIMDTPTIRRVSDAIQRRGGTNTIKMEATIGKYLNLCYDYNNAWETNTRYDNKVMETRKGRLDVYEEHSDTLHKWINKCARLQQKGLSIVTESMIAGFAFFLENKLHHDEQKIVAFLEELLVDGAARNTTVLFVRKKLMRNKMKVELIPRQDELRYITRAWNDFILGRQVQSIKTTEESFRFVRPL